MKILYVPKNFSSGSMEFIDIANVIIDEYQAQGFDLTLRQLYYQLVARDLFPDDRRWKQVKGKWVRDPNGTKNADPNYKWLGSQINDGRLAGLISWRAIVDRTRNLRKNSHWSNPSGVLISAAHSYLEDRWENQEYRPEVWIEKDALVGVITDICQTYDVPHFSCRGYVSQSEMWLAGYERLRKNNECGQKTIIIHLGDHDPSGVDMTRDIEERLLMFSDWAEMDIERIALNMDQIRTLNPPPNPAKITDSRAKAYIAEFGDESWELDALEPQYIVNLITNALNSIIDLGAWEETEQRINEHRETLIRIANNYNGIRKALDDMEDEE